MKYLEISQSDERSTTIKDYDNMCLIKDMHNTV